MVKIDLGKIIKGFATYFPGALNQVAGGSLSDIRNSFDERKNIHHVRVYKIEYQSIFNRGENGQIEFLVLAMPHDKKRKPRLKIENLQTSQGEVNKSRYIADREIKSDGVSVSARCRIKRFPDNPYEVKNNPLYNDIFRFISRELFRVVRCEEGN